MSGLEFVAALANHLAWPIVVLTLFLALRRSLLAQIPWLNRLRYKDFEVEFRREVQQAELVIARAEPRALPPAHREESSDPESLAEVSPRAALIEAWIGFETTAASSVQALQRERARVRPFSRLVDALLDAKLITEEENVVLRDLRGLRNRAVHDLRAQLRAEDARRYSAVLRDLGEEVAARAWSQMPKSC